MSMAFVFPGQGSQKIGMGSTLAAFSKTAKNVFEEVDESLGYGLSEIMWNGEASELTLTVNAQPAIMAVSIALTRVLEDDFGFDIKSKVSFVAGHSLGEYSALVTAGSISLTDSATLLRERGLSMQECVAVGKGKMFAILGLEREKVTLAIKDALHLGICSIANNNAPGQIVISGDKRATEAAAKNSLSLGARRTIELPVSAPFHCALMKDAGLHVHEKLANIKVEDPLVTPISNVTARPIKSANEIKKLLVQQITSEVKWMETIQYLCSEKVEIIVEIGEGNILHNLTKRIDKNVRSLSISCAKDIEELLVLTK